MMNVVELALQELDPDARMDAYYYSFDHTGVGIVDRVLSEVADAGKAYHHTGDWMAPYEGKYLRGGRAESHEERIQLAAAEAAAVIRALIDKIQTLQTACEVLDRRN